MEKKFKFYILLLIIGVVGVFPIYCSTDYCPPDWVVGTWMGESDDFILEINENNITETINGKSFDLNSMFRLLDNSSSESDIVRVYNIVYFNYTSGNTVYLEIKDFFVRKVKVSQITTVNDNAVQYSTNIRKLMLKERTLN